MVARYLFTCFQGVAPTLVYPVPSPERYWLLSKIIRSIRDYYPLWQVRRRHCMATWVIHANATSLSLSTRQQCSCLDRLFPWGSHLCRPDCSVSQPLFRQWYSLSSSSSLRLGYLATILKLSVSPWCSFSSASRASAVAWPSKPHYALMNIVADSLLVASTCSIVSTKNALTSHMATTNGLDRSVSSR